ncbi:ParB/Srx family N-terminal domain-containing protein [Bradyrhizobium sp. 215_C5_N1_1]|uniref:ParB/Srx family N-terminal domain-containing protein n=1 Tax=unclassified Bradyrhizobium TaxID=2631580 RepID=UPI003F8CB0C5
MDERIKSAPGPAWAIETRKVNELIPSPRNARLHSDEQIEQIAASISQFGFTVPLLVTEDDTIIAGHGRLDAAKHLGLLEVPVIVARGWTDAMIRAYALVDNRLPELATWNLDLVKLEVEALRLTDMPIDRLGFSDKDLGSMLAARQFHDEQLVDPLQGTIDNRGDLLARLEITIADPRHAIERGDHYRLGRRHHLLCCGVMVEWERWKPLLTGTTIFCPYPGPFVAFGEKADKYDLLLVQPDQYTAGHILDRYEDIHGTGSVVRITND